MEEGEDSLEEDGAVWDDDADIPYEEGGDDGVGCRIALNKMDWDLVTALDLLALFRSLCTGDKVVKKV